MRQKRTREQGGGSALTVGAFAIVFAMLCLPVVGTGWAATIDLEALLKRVAVGSAKEVPFEERRFIGAVTEPLVSRGYLRYEPPNKLIKKVESPYRETAVVDDDHLSVLDADGAETTSISLWISEDLRLMFDSLRAVLRGDVKALRVLFEVSVSGDETAWTLDLTPKDDPDASRIERIVVTGNQERLLRFDIREAGGDRTLIQMRDASSRP